MNRKPSELLGGFSIKDMNRIITIAGLLIFTVIILLPPIIHGYVYPNIGDDTAVYLTVFDSFRNGLPSVQYLGYILVGYTMNFLSDISGVSIEILFMWFNFISLALVGIVLYMVVSRLVNKWAGWLALILTLFCAQGVLFLFYYGQIFNVINMGIILPLLIYFTIKYLKEKKVYQLVLAIILVGLFGSFHTSGIYLPAIAGFAVITYVIYSWVKKQKVDKTAVYLGSGIVAFSILAFVYFVLLPTIVVLERYTEWENINFIQNIGKGLAVPLAHYLLDILSLSVLILGGLVAIYFKDTLKSMSGQVKVLAFLLFCIALILAIASFAKISLDPWRQALDLATMFALLLAVFLGLMNYKSKLVIAVIVIALGFGTIPNLSTWFGYNSAIRQVDLEALEYADNFETFSCSDTVASWIYVRYTSAKLRPNGGDIVIMRNNPMTPRSTEDNIWFQKHGWSPDNSYELTKSFSDGEVDIEVYEVMDEYKK